MPDRPAITDDHKKKYEAIMGTAVKSAVPPPPTQSTPTESSSKVNALLSALPKAKGIGNKMFIFTGKKKIILETGGEKEVEKVKTVDAAKEKAPELLEMQVAKGAPQTSAPDQEAKLKEGKPKEETKEEKKEVKPEVKDTKPTESKKARIPMIVVVLLVVAVIAGWTLFWAKFFNFI